MVLHLLSFEEASLHRAYRVEALKRATQRRNVSSVSGARVAARVEQLGAILEVHRVEVIPAAAPYEALGLERVDDGLRVAVLPHERLVLAFVAPVVRARRVEID